jgi:hypothetical protein
VNGSIYMPSGNAVQWNGDTGVSRDSAGVVDVGNGTAGNASGAINAALYKGPSTAPTGACSVVGWAFTQDGHISFCDGTNWVLKM